MAFSSFPDSTPANAPPTQIKVRRTHSQPTLWAIATVSFLIGSAATGLTIWQMHKLYRATVAPVVDVVGQVQARYSYQEDVDELRPTPSGYFIETPGVGRVYLTGRPLASYVGKEIKASGSVAGICGPKSIPCYPIVEVREVGLVSANE